MKNMKGKTIGIIIVVLAVIVGGYFLLKGSYETPTPTPTPTVTPEKTEEPTQTPPTTQVPVSGITEISVVGTEFSFSPSSISVKAGEQVKISFKNNGRAPHNLTLEGLGIGTKTIGGGQTDIVEFTAPSAGMYTFFCSVSGHRAAGMEGSLRVE
jgi:nitrite reductase (NO-forming)